MYSYGPVSLFPTQNKSFLPWRGHADGSGGGRGEKRAGGVAERGSSGYPQTRALQLLGLGERPGCPVMLFQSKTYECVNYLFLPAHSPKCSPSHGKKTWVNRPKGAAVHCNVSGQCRNQHCQAYHGKNPPRRGSLWFLFLPTSSGNCPVLPCLSPRRCWTPPKHLQGVFENTVWKPQNPPEKVPAGVLTIGMLMHGAGGRGVPLMLRDLQLKAS